MSNRHPLVQAVEASQLRKDIPEFSAGDTVVVQVRVKEGDRERLQAFEGIVIAKRNRGLNSAFTVRKISSGIGVERVFQTHSPLIGSVEVKRRGDVRRAKLYYLRERSGKSARIKERLTGRKVADKVEEELVVEQAVEQVETPTTENPAVEAPADNQTESE